MENLSSIILLLALVIIFVYILTFPNMTESFRSLGHGATQAVPVLDYSRVYPGLFAYNPGFYPDSNFLSSTNRDYGYIAQHQYLNNMINGVYPETNCIVPPTISADCVYDRVNETGNYNEAINNCTVPASVSESCASGRMFY